MKSIIKNQAISWTIWTLLLFSLANISIKQEADHAVALSINTARADLAKDKAIRLWGSLHGGVYVPSTDKTPPNPNLAHIPHRDLKTSIGELTLMNPAYIISQMMREFEGLYGTKGHLTSLKPLNPQNQPDSWEITKLLLFENKERERNKMGKLFRVRS